MLRRPFFQWMLAALAPGFFPRLLRAQLKSFSESDIATLREVAAVVLPTALGRTRTDRIADDFAEWVRDYKAGAEVSTGYGFPSLRSLPPNPSKNYAEQLAQLNAGGSFVSLDAGAKKEAIAAALRQSGLDRLPPRPNGKHIAADLMSYFYLTGEGQDFLYGAAINADDCSGLASSAARPAPLS
jgi:hypothetical protein